MKQALGTISATTDWDVLDYERVETYREKYEVLDQLVGEKRPEDIEGVGVLFTDELALRKQFERLLESRAPEIEEVSGGVIIK